MNPVSVISVPFALGQKRGGVDEGPEIMLQNGLATKLENMNFRVEKSSVYVELDNEQGYEPDSKWKEHNAVNVSRACHELSKQTNTSRRAGNRVLTLGGDHSVAIGSISGLLNAVPELRVLWIDAHADINTPETTDTGNMHGMPVAYLMGLCKASHHFDWLHSSEQVPLKPNRIAYIGLRDVDPGEKKILADLGVTAFSMSEVDRMGIQKVVDEALRAIDPNNEHPLHFSFDIDGLDPSVAGSTGTPVQGGLTYREGRYICERVAETGRMISMDMVEVNPLLEPQSAKQTAKVANEMIATAFGSKLL
jgi:arginase